MDKPLLTSRTGGYSLLSFFVVTAGLVMLIFQIILLTNGSDTETQAWTRFLPGGLGLVFLAFFALTTRRGNIQLYPDRITGKTAQGKAYEILFEDIGEVDLSGRNFWLKNKDGKTMLLDKPPINRQTAGLIWLILQYPQSNPEKWTGFPNVSPKQATACLRIFKDESGNHLFGDRGFLIQVEGATYAFPASRIASFPPSDPSKQGMTFTPVQALAQFDPSPTALPLPGFISAFRSSKPEVEQLKDMVSLLMEAHGGLAVKPLEENQWQGRLNELDVLVKDLSLPAN